LSGWQLDVAAQVLDDATGGTPQRFLWFWATDPAVPRHPPPWPRFTRPALPVRPFTVAQAVSDEVHERAWRRVAGRAVVDELDAPRALPRLKVAALLAVLDNRGDLDVDDWRLAGMVLAASDRVRDRIKAEAAAVDAATEQTRTARVVRQTAAVEEDQA